MILAVTLSAIAGLFFLFGPAEKTLPFYFNLGFACLIDVLFFCSLFIVSGKKHYTVQGIALAKQIMTYGLLSTVLILGYSLTSYFYPIPFPWYLGAVILLTVIYFIIIIVTFQGGQVQRETAERLKQTGEASRKYTKQIPDIHEYFVETMSKKNADPAYRESVKKSLKILHETATFVPTKLYVEKPELAQNVSRHFEELMAETGKIVHLEGDALIKQLENIHATAKRVTKYIQNNK
ncbi:MAG: hypothetical protein LBD59_07160 [Prevotellaceae bacterium]|nr:hypothetical protein [Prevotellaceae bacterium]